MENEKKALDHKRKIHMELSKALAVMGIKPNTFHSVVSTKNQLKKLLEKSLLERTKALNTKSFDELKAERNPYLQVADLSTIHEAYQFLMMKYVDNDEASNLFLTTDQLCSKYSSSRRSSASSQGVSFFQN